MKKLLIGGLVASVAVVGLTGYLIGSANNETVNQPVSPSATTATPTATPNPTWVACMGDISTVPDAHYLDTYPQCGRN